MPKGGRSLIGIREYRREGRGRLETRDGKRDQGEDNEEVLLSGGVVKKPEKKVSSAGSKCTASLLC